MLCGRYIIYNEDFNFHGYMYRNNYSNIQRDATLHNLFYLESALHVSDGTSTHHQERIQLYLQHLVFVTPLLLPVAMQFQLFHDSGR